MKLDPHPTSVPATNAKLIGGVLGVWACFTVLAFAIVIWGSPAKANDRYNEDTGKNCTSCHVNVNKNAYKLTQDGKAFKKNDCPGVRGGCD
jgi:hypothetical protein